MKDVLEQFSCHVGPHDECERRSSILLGENWGETVLRLITSGHTCGRAALASLALLGFVCAGALQAQTPSLSDPASIVKTEAYASLDPVPQGKEFQVAVVVHIADGFHMNSNKPSESYLIATTLTPELPAGIKLADIVYPDGHLQKFSFSPDKPLDVYAGTVTLRLRMAAQPGLAPGATKIPITLRYQACNNTSCLRPVKVPVMAEISVAPAGTPAHAVHSDIFSAAGSSGHN